MASIGTSLIIEKALEAIEFGEERTALLWLIRYAAYGAVHEFQEHEVGMKLLAVAESIDECDGDMLRESLARYYSYP